MKHHVVRYHSFFYQWRRLVSGEVIALGLALFLVVSPVFAVRFQDRGLFMQSALPGVTTSYTIKFQYVSPDPVGSVDFKVCTNPISFVTTDVSCDIPAGVDLSNAVLTNQSGEMGFSIRSRSKNEIVLTRPPTVPVATTSSIYTFSGIVNPTNTNEAFAVRLESHGSTDASGPYIDFGSVRGAVSKPIVIETQVAPTLVFCAAQEVDEHCASTNEKYYSDMGEISDTSTLTATSQMAVGTNASGGFAITAYGDYLSAGTHTLNSPTSPTASKQGSDQFGINLVENTAPAVGKNPDGDFTNAVASPNYAQPNKYMYRSGDVVAFSPNVSLTRRFTVSYIINASPTLRAGVYTTTINYVASGQF